MIAPVLHWRSAPRLDWTTAVFEAYRADAMAFPGAGRHGRVCCPVPPGRQVDGARLGILLVEGCGGRALLAAALELARADVAAKNLRHPRRSLLTLGLIRCRAFDMNAAR